MCEVSMAATAGEALTATAVETIAPGDWLGGRSGRWSSRHPTAGTPRLRRLPTLMATVDDFKAKGLINLEKVIKRSRSEPAKVRDLIHSLAA